MSNPECTGKKEQQSPSVMKSKCNKFLHNITESFCLCVTYQVDSLTRVGSHLAVIC